MTSERQAEVQVRDIARGFLTGVAGRLGRPVGRPVDHGGLGLARVALPSGDRLRTHLLHIWLYNGFEWGDPVPRIALNQFNHRVSAATARKLGLIGAERAFHYRDTIAAEFTVTIQELPIVASWFGDYIAAAEDEALDLLPPPPVAHDITADWWIHARGAYGWSKAAWDLNTERQAREERWRERRRPMRQASGKV